MTQLEMLKLDVTALTERINSAIAVNEDSVTLTRQQLKDFAQAIQEATVEKVKSAIEDVNIDIEDHVSLELDRLELEINVDRSDVLSEIVSNIDDPDEITDEDVVKYLDTLKK
jgi:hypothetical protein